MLEVKLTDRARRGWDWEVRDDTGKLVARGPAAKYQAERALFQLLNVMSRRQSADFVAKVGCCPMGGRPFR
jgi:hypothetical protein